MAFKIADVVVNNVNWEVRSQDYPLQLFEVEGVETHFRSKIIKITSDLLVLPSLSSDEKQQVILYTQGWQNRTNNRLLLSREVRNAVFESFDRPEKTAVIIYKNWVVIYDYLLFEVKLFYEPTNIDPSDQDYIDGYYPSMLAGILPYFHATIWHAAGVIRNRRAAIFLAPSGGGKSTVVGLSDSAPLLSDDQIALREISDSVFAYSTPLSKSTDGPLEAPLGGIFILEKGKPFGLTPVRKIDMVQCLWHAYCYSMTISLKLLNQRAMSVICSACRAPVFKMKFPKDYVDWDIVDAAMEGELEE